MPAALLSCLYEKNHVPLATVSTRNRLGRIAARKAMAAAEGLPSKKPSLYKLPFREDTTHDKPYHCVAKAPADFSPSNRLALAQIEKYGKP